MAKDTAAVVAIILLCITIGMVANGVYFKMQERQREREWKNETMENMKVLAAIDNNLANAGAKTLTLLEKNAVREELQNQRLDNQEESINGIPRYDHQGTCMIVKNPNAIEYEMRCKVE